MNFLKNTAFQRLFTIGITTLLLVTTILKTNAALTSNDLYALAESYATKQDFNNAIMFYEKSLLTATAEEAYTIHSSIARLYENLGNWTQALEHYLAAFTKQSQRAEPLIHLAQHYSLLNEHAVSYLFARHAAELPPCNDATLNYNLNDLLSVNSWHVGDFARGHGALIKALALHGDSDHLLGNLALYVSKKKLETSPSLKILQLMPSFNGTGGVQTHCMTFNRELANHGIPARIITNSPLVLEMVGAPGAPLGQPCATYKHLECFARASDIIEQAPDIVICNWINEVSIALKVRNYLPIKIIYVHHEAFIEALGENLTDLSNCDGIVLVDPRLPEYLKQLFTTNNLKKPMVTSIPPFTDADKFLQFMPQRTKTAFFNQEYNLTIPTNTPIITMLANMKKEKNHALLIEAFARLKKDAGNTSHLMLPGIGRETENLKKLINDLQLNDCVHLLGATLNTEELLYHTDIHVLASSHEGFPIAHMEAALMKKPLIGSSTTSVTTYIKPNINGFVFENNKVNDLANKLEYLLKNPNHAAAMGANAYAHACKNFTPAAIFAQWESFLRKI